LYALKRSYSVYASAGMLPHRTARFYRAKRSLASRFQDVVPEAPRSLLYNEANSYALKLQQMCSKGQLRPRNGLLLQFKSTPALPVLVGQTAVITITLINGSKGMVKIAQWDLLRRPAGETALSDSGNIIMTQRPFPLHPEQRMTFTIRYTPISEGCSPSLFVVDAGNNNHAALMVPLEATSRLSREQAATKRPYVPRKPLHLPQGNKTIGEKPVPGRWGNGSTRVIGSSLGREIICNQFMLTARRIYPPLPIKT
jgi:hypothetical protein